MATLSGFIPGGKIFRKNFLQYSPLFAKREAKNRSG
jgi:hypothetical protein